MILPTIRLLAAWPVTALLLILALTGCEITPVQPSGHVVVQDKSTRMEVAFNKYDRERIRRYYASERRKKTKKLPPGLAKKQQLPPGLNKQVQRHGRLPPGLAGRALPAELERELAPLPVGYVRIRVGGDVVLANEHTRVVLDVVHDVVL